MFSYFNIVFFLVQSRKRIILLSIITFTLLFSITYTTQTIIPLSSKPLEEFITSMGGTTINLPLGSGFDTNESIMEVENIHKYFHKNLPSEIKTRMTNNVTVYTYINFVEPLNVSINITNTQVNHIALVTEKEFNLFLGSQDNTNTSSDIPIDKLDEIDGIIFQDEYPTEYYNEPHICTLTYYDNDIIANQGYNFLLVNKQTWKNRIELKEMGIFPTIILPYKNFKGFPKDVGYQNTFLNLKFSKNSYSEIVVQPHLRESILQYFNEFHSYLQSYNWDSFEDFHIYNNIINSYNLINSFLNFFMFLLIVTLIPCFITVLYLISFTEKIRLSDFLQKYQRRLTYFGFSKKFILTYYLIEFFMITACSFMFALVISSVIEANLKYHLTGTFEYKFLDTATYIFREPLFSNILFLFLIITHFLFNRQLYISSSQKLLSTNYNGSFVKTSVFSFNKVEFRTFIFTVIVFLSIFFLFHQISDLFIVIILLASVLSIWTVHFWIVYSLKYLGKIIKFLSEKSKTCIAVNIFHKHYLSQSQILTMFFWIIILSIIIPSTFNSYIINTDRDSYYYNGGDLRIQVSPTFVNDNISQVLGNFSNIEYYTSIYETKSTFGTEFTSSPNIYELIGIDPSSFFNSKAFNKDFLYSKSVIDIEKKINENSSILLPISDYNRIIKDDSSEIHINGYLNYSAKTTRNIVLKIADKIEYWPSRSLQEINDFDVQLITSKELFFDLIEGMNLSINRVILIDLKTPYISEELYKCLLDFSNEITISNNVDIEGRATNNIYTQVIKKLFSIYSSIVDNISILISLPISFIFLYFLYFKTKNTIGILESLGITTKDIVKAMIFYFISLISIIIVGIFLILFAAFMIISTFRTGITLPIHISIHLESVLFIIILETIIIGLNGIIYNNSLNTTPASLIIQRD